MCGIIYVKRYDKKPVAKMVLKRYRAQKARGSDGFGYVTINSPAKTIRRANETDIVKCLEAEQASEIIFHHRFPTSTPNIAEMAHPIMINNPILKHKYLVVHNGVITNDDDMKEKHEKLGFKYNTEMQEWYEVKATEQKYYFPAKYNDSEALAIEIALCVEGHQDKIEALGSTAFIALQTDEKNKAIKLFYGRNEGNPLKRNDAKDFMTITSEGAGTLITPHKLYCYDYATGTTTETDLLVGERKIETCGYKPSHWWTSPSYPDAEASEYDYSETIADSIEMAQEDLNVARYCHDNDAILEAQERLARLRSQARLYD